MIATLEQTQRLEAANSDPIVASLENVNKNYGSVRALHGVDFRVRAGEVVALPILARRERHQGGS